MSRGADIWSLFVICHPPDTDNSHYNNFREARRCLDILSPGLTPICRQFLQSQNPFVTARSKPRQTFAPRSDNNQSLLDVYNQPQVSQIHNIQMFCILNRIPILTNPGSETIHCSVSVGFKIRKSASALISINAENMRGNNFGKVGINFDLYPGEMCWARGNSYLTDCSPTPAPSFQDKSNFNERD